MVTSENKEIKFDVFLSHNSTDKPAVRYLKDKLVHRGINCWFDERELRSGADWISWLETGLQQSRCCAIFYGPFGLGPWHEVERQLAQLMAAEEWRAGRRFGIIPVRLPGAPDWRQLALPPFLRLYTSVDFQYLSDEEALNRLSAGIRQDAPPPTEDDTRPPYVGMRPFTEGESDVYTGRSNYIIHVAEHLRRGRGPRFLSVLGASGSGKSSLLRAGLLPRLKSGALFPESKDWHYLFMRPGSDAWSNLRAVLMSYEEIRPLVGLLNPISESSLHEIITAALGHRNGHLVLIVDQFEELFTARPQGMSTDAERRRQEYFKRTWNPFIQNLVYAAREPSGVVSVLVSIRSDFVSCFFEDSKLGPLLEEVSLRCLVQPLNEWEVRAAIEGPAVARQVQFESALVETATQDYLLDAAGALPFLQEALRHVWEKGDRKQLTLQSYREFGGLRGALNAHADSVVEELVKKSPEKARLVGPLFVHLTRLADDGGLDTKRRRPLLELPGGEPAQALARELSGEDSRLLILDEAITDSKQSTSSEIEAVSASSNEHPAEHVTVEIVHESLLSGWDRLKEWNTLKRPERLRLRRLEAAARSWKEDKQGSASLLSSSEYRKAKVICNALREEVPFVLQEYLRCSAKRVWRDRSLWVTAILVFAILISSGIGAAIKYRHQLLVEASQYTKKANELMRKDHLREASPACREVVWRYERVNRFYPPSNEIRTRLALAYVNLAICLVEDETTKQEAGILTKRALALDAVTGDSQTADEFLYEFSEHYETLGAGLVDAGDNETGLRVLTRALQIDESRSRKDPASTILERRVALACGDIAEYTEDVKERLAFRERAVKAYADVDQKDPGIPGSMHELAIAYHDLGDVQYDLKKYEAALGNYQSSLKIHRVLVGWQGAQQEWKGDLGTTENDVARTFRMMGKFSDALPFYRESCKAFEELARDEPSKDIWSSNLAVTYSNLAVALSYVGTCEESVLYSRKVREIREALLRNEPDDLSLQDSLATAERNLGYGLRQSGDIEGAAREFRVALVLRQKAAQKSPSSQGERQLAEAMNDLAKLLPDQGHLNDASALCQQSLEKLRRLSVESPADSNVKSDLARVLATLGTVAKYKGSLKAARDFYEEVRRIREELTLAVPDDDYLAMNTSYSDCDLAWTTEVQGNEREAQQLLERAFEIQKNSLTRQPENTFWQEDFCQTASLLGAVSKAQGNLTEAIKMYEMACDSGRRLAKSDPTEIWTRARSLAETLEKMSIGYRLQGRLDEAIASANEGLEIRENVLKRDAGHAAFRAEKAWSQTIVAEALFALGRDTEAAPEYAAAVAQYNSLVACDPENTLWKSQLAWILIDSGEMFLADGKADGAFAQLSGASDIMRELLPLDLENVSWRWQAAWIDGIRARALFSQGEQNLAHGITVAREAVGLQKTACEIAKDNLLMQQDYAVTLDTLGQFLSRQSNFPEATVQLQASRRLLSDLTTKDPSNLELKKYLAYCFLHLGVALKGLGTKDSCTEALRYVDLSLDFSAALRKIHDREADAISREATSLKEILSSVPLTSSRRQTKKPPSGDCPYPSEELGCVPIAPLVGS